MYCTTLSAASWSSPSCVAQPLDGDRRLLLADLAHEGAEGPAELQRPARPVAVPERHLPRLARRRRDHDALEGDVLDAPRGRPEQEGLARPGLVDHLLVQLADAGAVGQEDAEQAPVGDGAAAGDGQALGAVARPHPVGDAIPHDARPQLAELLRRVAAGQQVEHGGEHVVGDVGETGRAAHEGGQLRHRPLLHGGGGHDLLGQHVERVAQVARLLDEALAHPPHDDGGLEQVAAVLGEDGALRRLADRVTGPADALQAPADGAGRLDLDHEVDRAHVDAELQAAGGDQAAQLAPLELVLDHDALLTRQRAVVGPHQVAAALGQQPLRPRPAR